jgi:hypothetical protein
LRPHRPFTSTSELRDFCHLQRPPHPLSRPAGHRSHTSLVTMSKAAEAAIAASYKSLKEDFVSNLTGGEIGEINYVTAVAPVSSPLLVLVFSNSQKGSSDSLVGVTITTVIL